MRRYAIGFALGYFLGVLVEMLCPNCGAKLNKDTIEEFERRYAEWLKTKPGQFAEFIAKKTNPANHAEGESESS